MRIEHVTTTNIETIRQQVPTDHATKLQPGCITITWPHDGTIATCWPNHNLAAVTSGTNTEWCAYTGTPGHADFQWTLTVIQKMKGAA